MFSRMFNLLFPYNESKKSSKSSKVPKTSTIKVSKKQSCASSTIIQVLGHHMVVLRNNCHLITEIYLSSAMLKSYLHVQTLLMLKLSNLNACEWKLNYRTQRNGSPKTLSSIYQCCMIFSCVERKRRYFEECW